jgi:ATP-dependent DNA ligase
MSVASRPRLPIALAQPTPAYRPPVGAGWIHEIKFDGYRLLAQRHGVGGRLLTRNGHDWTDRYPIVLKALMALKIQANMRANSSISSITR